MLVSRASRAVHRALGRGGERELHFGAADTRRILFVLATDPWSRGTLLRHAAVLRAAGLDALAIDPAGGGLLVGPDDCLVVDASDIGLLARRPRPQPHVVVDGDGFRTWLRAAELSAHLEDAPDLRAVVALSEYTAALHALALPGGTVHQVRPSIDPAQFHAGPAPGERRVALLPGGADDAARVIRLLLTAGRLAGWEVADLTDPAREDRAEDLRRCRVALALSHQEGLGRGAAEAMASGCYVVGYDAYGGREFFDPAYSTPVPTGDVLAAAEGFAEAIERDSVTGRWCRERGLAASQAVLDRYSPDRERADVLAAYAQVAAAAGTG